MPSAHRGNHVLVAIALSVLATLVTAASALAGGAPGPWPQ